MSARSIGRGRCPKCGREGSVVIKMVGGKEYVYVKHGRTWHYIGSLEKIDVNEILREPTTALPLKETETLNIHGEKMNEETKSLNKTVVEVIALILVAVGTGILLLTIFASIILPYLVAFWSVSSVNIATGFSTTIEDTTKAYLIYSPIRSASIRIQSDNAYFKILAVPLYTAMSILNATQSQELETHISPSDLRVKPIKTSDIQGLMQSFFGNYTSYDIQLDTNQALLVWPYKLQTKPASLSFYTSRSLTGSEQPQPNSFQPLLMSIIFISLAPRLILGVSLIIGGYLLYRWSKNK